METPISDIYLERRRRSRAGCLTALGALLLAGVVGGGYGLWRWWEEGRGYAGEVAFPEAAIEAPAEGVLPGVGGGGAGGGAAVKGGAASGAAAAGDTAAGVGAGGGGEEAEERAAPADVVAGDAETAAEVKKLLTAAGGAKRRGKLQLAREKALAALEADAGNEKAEALLNGIAMPLLASRAEMPEKAVYRVKAGDSLGKIAARFNCPVRLIQMANGIRGENIRVGIDVTVFDGSKHVFAVTVDRARNTLLLTIDGRYFKRYIVGTGKDNGTPLGEYKIIEKVENPVWWREDGTAVPYTGKAGENVLGTHWLALNLRGYGLHGTWEPETLGRQTSAGCIRLCNEDIRELFSILPRGTVVAVVE